jgi:hypothetical protein
MRHDGGEMTSSVTGEQDRSNVRRLLRPLKDGVICRRLVDSPDPLGRLGPIPTDGTEQDMNRERAASFAAPDRRYREVSCAFLV